MHYAPSAGYARRRDRRARAFLGTTRLTAPCEAFGAIAVFHGHAHHGSLEGRTPKGIPVYNVAMPLLKKTLDRRFRVSSCSRERRAREPDAHMDARGRARSRFRSRARRVEWIPCGLRGTRSCSSSRSRSERAAAGVSPSRPSGSEKAGPLASCRSRRPPPAPPSQPARRRSTRRSARCSSAGTAASSRCRSRRARRARSWSRPRCSSPARAAGSRRSRRRTARASGCSRTALVRAAVGGGEDVSGRMWVTGGHAPVVYAPSGALDLVAEALPFASRGIAALPDGADGGRATGCRSSRSISATGATWSGSSPRPRRGCEGIDALPRRRTGRSSSRRAASG